MGSIFSEADDLPIYTSILLGASDWMIKYQLWLFLGLISLGGFVYSNRKNEQWQTKMAAWLLTVPVSASLIKQIERIRFNSAMSLMLDAGLKVDTAVNHAADNTSNPIISQSLKIANDKIKKGAAVSVSLGETPIYPEFYVSLLEVGEESGRLSNVFGEIAKRSKEDFEQWINKVTNVLEPLLILVMGGIVGSVVVTMLLSVVSVNDINL
jgi:type II secretory pathway component PulF